MNKINTHHLPHLLWKEKRIESNSHQMDLVWKLETETSTKTGSGSLHLKHSTTRRSMWPLKLLSEPEIKFYGITYESSTHQSRIKLKQWQAEEVCRFNFNIGRTQNFILSALVMTCVGGVDVKSVSTIIFHVTMSWMVISHVTFIVIPHNWVIVNVQSLLLLKLSGVTQCGSQESWGWRQWRLKNTSG